MNCRAPFATKLALAALSLGLAVPTSKTFASDKCSEQLPTLVAPKSKSMLRHNKLSGSHTVKGLGKILISPYTFPVKVVINLGALPLGKQASLDPTFRWARRIDIARDGAAAVTGYIIYENILDRYSIVLSDLQAESEEEFSSGGQDSFYVFAGVFPKEEFKTNEAIRIMSEAFAKKTKATVTYVTAENWSELAEKLSKASKEHKRPITHLDMYGHGNTDALFAGNHAYTIGHLRADFDPATIGSAYEDKDSTFFSKLSPSTFAQQGQFRWNGCLTGQNEDNLLMMFGEKMFVDGGVIHASKLAVYPAGINQQYFSKKENPKWLEKTYKAVELPVRQFLLGKELIEAAMSKEDRKDELKPFWGNPYTRLEIKKK